MSEFTKERVTCPYCHKEGEFTFWDTVNVSLNPELREKIFSEELFLYCCPHCHRMTGVPQKFRYYDMKHQFLLYFEFFEPDDYDYASIELLPNGWAKYGLLQTQRRVFGLNRLKEKIVLLENGLNDVAIERQKYMIKHLVIPELAEKGYKLYFDHTEGPTDGFPYGTIIFLYEDKEKDKSMQVSFSMEDYYEHKMACEMDPRMEVKGLQCIDEGWISKQLKEE